MSILRCIVVVFVMVASMACAAEFTAAELAVFQSFRTGTTQDKWNLMQAVHDALPTIALKVTQYRPWLPDPDPNVMPSKTVTEAEVIKLLGEPRGGRYTYKDVTMLDYYARPSGVQMNLRVMIYQGRVYARTISFSTD